MKNKLLFNNTYNSGSATVFIYEKGKKYVGVCLEFGLVIKAASMERAEECIKDIAETYFKNIVENKLSEELLNRPAEKKYWEIYKHISELMGKRVLMQPISTSKVTPFSLRMLNYPTNSFLTA